METRPFTRRDSMGYAQNRRVVTRRQRAVKSLMRRFRGMQHQRQSAKALERRRRRNQLAAASRRRNWRR